VLFVRLSHHTSVSSVKGTNATAKVIMTSPDLMRHPHCAVKFSVVSLASKSSPVKQTAHVAFDMSFQAEALNQVTGSMDAEENEFTASNIAVKCLSAEH